MWAFVSAAICYAPVVFSPRAFLVRPRERSEMLLKEILFYFPPSLSLRLALSLAHGKCKLNSFCMFEEFSQITRSSLRLSLFNCPSISLWARCGAEAAAAAAAGGGQQRRRPSQSQSPVERCRVWCFPGAGRATNAAPRGDVMWDACVVHSGPRPSRQQALF